MASEEKTTTRRKAVAPPPIPERPKRPMVGTAGKQEDFAPDAAELAVKLGWDGPDHFQIDGLTVRDARRYIQKTLHEAFIAGAFGVASEDGKHFVTHREHPMPDLQTVCLHLAVDTPDEAKALGDMLDLALQAGKGAPVEQRRQKNANIVAEGEASAGSLLARVDAHERAIKEGKK